MALGEVWGISEFRRLLIGNCINMLGGSIFIIGMSWTVASSEGAMAYGMIFTAYFLGHLPLLFYGGMVVDRIPRRTVALIADLSPAVLVMLAISALVIGFGFSKASFRLQKNCIHSHNWFICSIELSTISENQML